MIAFTVCARNFLAQAQVLSEGLVCNHPSVRFHVALCDEMSQIDRDSFPFSLISVEELGIPRFREMHDRYSVTELNTSIKPFVFLYLFRKYPGEPVVYFDPDILVIDRLVELEEALSNGADCVLTPHLTEPAEFAEMNEQRLLQFGIYNLGFCALRDTEMVRRIVAWWGRRLEQECVIDLAAGLFVDQKWADLFPAFIEKTTILRHPGYNVAYWNLSQRTVRQTPLGWRVNGEPLRFFHFSGSVPDEKFTFSRHSDEFRTETLRDVAVLFRDYLLALRRFGLEFYRTIPFAFNWHGESGLNLHTPESIGGPRSKEGRGGDRPHLPLLRARSRSEYAAAVSAMPEVMARRREIESSLIPLDRDTFELAAHCAVCGAVERFSCSFMFSTARLPDGRRIPNWREHLDCRRCGFTNRLRACLHVLYQELSPAADARLYVTEQVTPLFDWIRERHPNAVGSEYLGDDFASGELVKGVRHEDIQNLSFDDEAFDFILSFEVLEHVPREKRALAELARCLSPSGVLVLTAPFHEDRDSHEVRAVLHEDGTVEHLLPPEYHGNPVDPEGGSLCFRYFGWSLMDDLRDAGFAEAEVLFYWSRNLGYLGDTNAIIVARK